MRNKVATAVILCVFCNLGFVTPSNADWVITPALTVSEIYTDDVSLDTSIPQSDFITQTAVGVSALSTGARFNFDGNYTLNHFYYPSLTENKNDFRHFLSATSDAEIVEDLFFIDGIANIQERFADRSSAFSGSNLSSFSENRGLSTQFSVSPYILRRLNGNFATMETRYRYNFSRFLQDDINPAVNNLARSSNIHEISVAINSGTKFNKFTWSFINAVSFEGTDNDTFNSYNSFIDAEYQFTREFALLASAGYSKVTGSTGSNFSGLVGGIGFRLTPGPRTSIEYFYSRTFFGYAHRVDASYIITPNMTFAVNYDDRFNSFQGAEFNNLIAGNDNTATLQQNFLSDGFARRQTWRSQLVGTRGRSTFTVDGFITKVAPDGNIVTSTRKSVGIIWDRSLSPQLSSTLGVFFVDDASNNNQISDKFLSYSAGLNYRLSRSLNLALQYIHSKRDVLALGFVGRRSNYVILSIGATF